MLSAEADRKLNKIENIEPFRKNCSIFKVFSFNQVYPFCFLFKLLPFPKWLPGDNCGAFHKWSGDDTRKAAELSISCPECTDIVIPDTKGIDPPSAASNNRKEKEWKDEGSSLWERLGCQHGWGTRKCSWLAFDYSWNFFFCFVLKNSKLTIQMVKTKLVDKSRVQVEPITGAHPGENWKWISAVPKFCHDFNSSCGLEEVSGVGTDSPAPQVCSKSSWNQKDCHDIGTKSRLSVGKEMPDHVIFTEFTLFWAWVICKELKAWWNEMDF